MKARFPGWSEPVLRPARFKSIRGGRGSGKSHVFAQFSVLLASGRAGGYERARRRIVCARDYASSATDSVQEAVKHYIAALGLDAEFTIEADRIWHPGTDSEILFRGTVVHPDRFKSFEGIDVLWFEQAECLTKPAMDVILPSVRKAGSEFWFTWNPRNRTDWVWSRFVTNPRPGDVSVAANWRHNPWWSETGLEDLRRDTEIYDAGDYPWIWEGFPSDDAGSESVLPYTMLAACVRAHAEGLAPPMQGHAVTYAGLDIAEGGADQCALVIRHGPTVMEVHRWPGVLGDLSAAAARAKDLCAPYKVARIYYDAAHPAKTDLTRAGFGGVRPVNFGGKVGGPDRLYEPRRPNKAVFARRNVQMAFALRIRASNTIRLLNGSHDVPAERCLFIPPDLPGLEALLAECAQPKRHLNINTGLWELDKAPAGAASPDRFDALCLAYAVETDGRGLRAR